MKERIYTIPITDALNEGCGCILCTIEKKLEEDAVTYFLGPSLMEPDSREDTNKNGFCRRHIHMLSCGKNTLGLALMLQTHIEELSKKYALKEKKGMFSKKSDIKSTVDELNSTLKSCSLCNKLDSQMEIAAQNLVYLIDHEKDFAQKFFEDGSLCAEHFLLALSVCEKELGGKHGENVAKKLCAFQAEALNELKNDLHEFTNSFDYRNSGQKPSQKATDSVPTTVKYIGKY